MLGQETDEAYLSEVLRMSVRQDCVRQAAETLRLVYTPFHGAGYRLVPEVLRRLGYRHILCVPEQMEIDGTFPTVKSPNPEEKEGFRLAIALAKQNQVDLIIGTDPDADRVGIVLRNGMGDYVTLSGNQVGVLLIDYLIRSKREMGTMPAHPAVIKTIVTTEMARKVCEENGVPCFDTFTGFKYMAERVKEFEREGSYQYIFAYEESYGYMCGDYVRDKDAVTASMLIAEMAAYYKMQGKTLYEAMESLYAVYGNYREHTINVVKPGVDGMEAMATIMKTLRQSPLEDAAGTKVLRTRDYQSGVVYDTAGNPVGNTEISGSNVLYFELADGTALIVRPSGTEPKIKVYILTRGDTEAEASQRVERYTAFAKQLMGEDRKS